jgi:hypothetical protein
MASRSPTSTARARRDASQKRTLRVTSRRVQHERRADRALASARSRTSPIPGAWPTWPVEAKVALLERLLRDRLASLAQEIGADDLELLIVIAEWVRSGRRLGLPTLRRPGSTDARPTKGAKS